VPNLRVLGCPISACCRPKNGEVDQEKGQIAQGKISAEDSELSQQGRFWPLPSHPAIHYNAGLCPT
jgi:hypothetical protein